MRARLRVLSNLGLIVGQCVLLFASEKVGLAIIIPSSFLSLPYFLHHRMWDVVTLMVFLNAINVIGFVTK